MENGELEMEWRRINTEELQAERGNPIPIPAASSELGSADTIIVVSALTIYVISSRLTKKME